MERLIDANALKKEAWPERYTGEGIIYVEDVDKAPTVDAVEVVHGHWIDSYIVRRLQHGTYPTVKCSKCGCYFCDVINNHHFMYHYCPNCGAKMDGDGND